MMGKFFHNLYLITHSQEIYFDFEEHLRKTIIYFIFLFLIFLLYLKLENTLNNDLMVYQLPCLAEYSLITK